MRIWQGLQLHELLPIPEAVYVQPGQSGPHDIRVQRGTQVVDTIRDEPLCEVCHGVGRLDLCTPPTRLCQRSRSMFQAPLGIKTVWGGWTVCEANIHNYARRVWVRDIRPCGTCSLQNEHLEGELQGSNMQQIGQSRRVWLQEVMRQGQQLRRRQGGRIVSRSGSARSWAYSAAALHSKMTLHALS